MLSGKILWVLIATYGHGAYAVPGIASKQACEDLAHRLQVTGWARSPVFLSGDTIRCEPYQIGAGYNERTNQ